MKLPFEIDEVDVTFKPQPLIDRGIRTVPVVEGGGRFLVGNATSDQLLEFLTPEARS